MYYDIAYSLICHENKELIIDLINNIIKYNSNIKFIIIIHLNDEMYNEFFNYKNCNLIINDIHYQKKKISFDITRAHFENFNLLIKNNILFKNFIFLASNCYFLKSIEKNTIKTINPLNEVKKTNTISYENIKNWYFKTNVYKNTKILELFKFNSIELRKGQIEGRTISYNTMYLINNFITINNVEKLIENLFPFEEMLIPTLQYYFTGNDQSNIICKVFWNNKNYYPSISDINNVIKNQTNIYCIKRIMRDKNCIIKNYIDNLP